MGMDCVMMLAGALFERFRAFSRRQGAHLTPVSLEEDISTVGRDRVQVVGVACQGAGQ